MKMCLGFTSQPQNTDVLMIGNCKAESERGQGALRRSVSVNLADAGTQGLRD